MKTEKVPILLVYSQGDKLFLEHPENGFIPIYQLIGFLECYLMDLKISALNSQTKLDGN